MHPTSVLWSVVVLKHSLEHNNNNNNSDNNNNNNNNNINNSNNSNNAFRKKDGSVRYTHIKVTRAQGYFTHDINGGGDNMYTADNICKMIEL